jgi:hypothetical protein
METSGVSRRSESGYSALDQNRETVCDGHGEPICRSDGSSDETLPPPGVMLCQRPAEVPLADDLGLTHQWLKTSHKEAGLGAGDGSVPGDGRSTLPYSMTRISDHTGQSLRADAECVYIASVDEGCVDKQLALGQISGSWTPTNNSQTFAADVLDYCSVVSLQWPPVDLEATGGGNE